MNRLFIILAAIAGITVAAWAYRHHQSASTVPTATAPTEETPTCCQKSPSRTTLLQAKPSTIPATATAAPTR